MLKLALAQRTMCLSTALAASVAVNSMRSALLQGTSAAITEGCRMELLIHSPRIDFLSLSWDSNLQILSHSHCLFFFLLSLPPSLFHIYFLVCMDSQSEHYEGLPFPDVIQSKKKAGTDFLSL